MNALELTHFTATSCIGRGLAPTLQALRERRGGLAPCHFERAELQTWIGAVAGVDDEPVRADLRQFECRNHRLAQLGLTQDGFADAVAAAAAHYGPARIGVFLGTSTSGILETELAYRRRASESGALPADFRYAHTHNCYSLAGFVRAYFALQGPAASISSACSSGAKVFGSAAAHDRGRAHRCGRGRRSRFALPHHLVRLQFARTAFPRAVPAIRR